MILSVYLAGPIELVTFGQAHDWRNKATDYLALHGVKGVNPYRQGGESGFGREINKSLITRRDKFLTRSCQICLADLRTDNGRGTLIELGMFFEADKPVFGWGGSGLFDQEAGDKIDPYEHPMISDIVCAWDKDLIGILDIILEFAP